MKRREFDRKPESKSGKPKKRALGTIVVRSICGCRIKRSNGRELQMNPFSFAALRHRSRARASKIGIAHFHSNLNGGSQPRPLQDTRDLIRCPERWFVKVVCSLLVHKDFNLDGCLCYLSKNLTPFIAFEVVKRLNDPKLGFRFLELSKIKLSTLHSFSTYNLLIRSFCQMGLHDLARTVFGYMRSDGYSPDGRILGFLVSAFAEKGELDYATRLLCDLCGIDGITSAANSLINTLVKLNRVEDAIVLFEGHLRSQRCVDAWTFNILIRGLCGAGKVDKAFKLFSEMGSFGCSPDTVTYNTLIKGLCRVSELERAHELLNEVKSRNDCFPDVVTYTSMISGYCKMGKTEEASLLLDEMINCEIYPSVITFNVLIDGFGKVGDMVLAESMYEKMPSFGCVPDVVTFTSMIDGYCRTGQVNQGLRLWDGMNARGLSPNVYTYSILINALCKENRLHEARDLLRQLKYKNITPKPFMYNPVIDGFCKAGNIDEGNAIVAEMEEKRCNPDKVTFTILIIGHCSKGRMFEAISIFNKMVAVGCSPDAITLSSLMSFLLKAGMAKEAFHLKKMASENQNVGETPLHEIISMRKISDVPAVA